VAWLHAVSYRVEVVESGKVAFSWVGLFASVVRCGCTLWAKCGHRTVCPWDTDVTKSLPSAVCKLPT